MVESESVVDRCKTGTIQEARAMNTSVVALPTRIMASEGEGRLRKRAIAPKKSKVPPETVPTRARASCHASIPENTSSSFAMRQCGGCARLEELALAVVAHQHHFLSVLQG